MAAPRAKSTLSGRACPKEELTHTAPGNRTLRAVFEPRGVLRVRGGVSEVLGRFGRRRGPTSTAVSQRNCPRGSGLWAARARSCHTDFSRCGCCDRLCPHPPGHVSQSLSGVPPRRVPINTTEKQIGSRSAEPRHHTRPSV